MIFYTLNIISNKEGENMKLLLADPDRDYLDAFKILLTLSGYSVNTAFDGTQVIQKLSEEKYEAVIINSEIPRISVSEIIKKCREMMIPTVIVSDKKVSSDLLNREIIGNTYLQLPFLPYELISAIKSVTENTNNKEILSFEDTSINAGRFVLCDKIPVTSDEINVYRSLIKKEPLDFKTSNPYIASLNRKFERLKKLTRIRYLINEGYRLVTISNG